jgi:hypothetical protein
MSSPRYEVIESQLPALVSARDDGSAMLQKADWTIATLRKLDIPIPPGSRLELARDACKKLATNDPVLSAADAPFQQYAADACRTVARLHLATRVASSIGELLTTAHRRKLQEALGGASLSSDEGPKDHARNIEFELFVHAWFSIGGANVGFGEPDLHLEISGETVGLAAKRLRNPRNALRRVAEAARQVRTWKGRGLIARGIIALNFDRVVQASRVVAPTDALRDKEAVELGEQLRTLSQQLALRPHLCCLMAFISISNWVFDGKVPRLVHNSHIFEKWIARTPEEYHAHKDFAQRIAFNAERTWRNL